MALCLHLVFRRTAFFPTRHTSRNECKPLAEHPDRMGSNLQQLLEVLVGADYPDRSGPLDPGILTQAALACRAINHRSWYFLVCAIS